MDDKKKMAIEKLKFSLRSISGCGAIAVIFKHEDFLKIKDHIHIQHFSGMNVYTENYSVVQDREISSDLQMAVAHLEEVVSLLKEYT